MKKWVFVAILALFTEAVSAQKQLPPGGQEFKEGDTAFKKKDWNAAITAFEAAVKANETLYASHYFLGWAYKNTSKPGKAAESFETFLNKVPNDPKAADMKDTAAREAGIGYARAKEYEKAIPFLTTAAEDKPNNTEVQFFLGFSQMQAGDEAAATQTFAKVIQLQPNLDRAHYYSGRIAFKNKEWAAARETLSKYIELQPEGPFAGQANYMLGFVSAQNGQKGGARSQLSKGLSLEPKAPQAAEAHYILGRYAAEAENFDSAASHFQRFLQLRPSGPQAEEARKFLADLK